MEASALMQWHAQRDTLQALFATPPSVHPPSTVLTVSAAAPAPAHVAPAPVAAPDPFVALPTQTTEEVKWAALAARYGDDCLRAHPTWVFVNGNWLPTYNHLPVRTITDVWSEYVDGISLNLPVRLLCEGWGAKWKENICSRITESSRHMSIVKLIEELSKKHR
ncbi:hypothetical protein EUX98_g2960 [Antrodiella citrinella]|uniref:Transcription activator GCR1-like domain-containing protein n=1 Tax=Antrodiella citrinella TaxID=2447956 RepID=A0A4S4N0I1_9APHY|nr:hypothetical protein EUX98_g2960 [Antrodiella citrinella]